MTTANKLNLSRMAELYESLKKAVKDKSIIFRIHRDFGGLVVDKRRNSPFYGLEFYVDKGTISLLELMKKGVEFDEIIKELKGYKEEERALEAISLRISIFFNEELMDKYTELWHPPESNRPHMAGWEITSRCNLRCIYCFSSSGPDRPASEMDTDEAFTVIRRLKDAEVLSVWIGGGEPLIRDDILRILKFLRRNDFFVQLSTNGILLHGKKELISQISDLVDEVHIPLDGATPETHNKQRGGYRKVVEVIREFTNLDKTLVSTGTVVTKINLGEIDSIIEQARSLGVNAWVWSPLFPIGRGETLKHIMLTKEDLVYLYKKLTKIAEELKDELLILSHTPGVSITKMLKPTARCGAAVYYIAIMPNGDVYPCGYFRWSEWKLGNILHQDVETILNTPKAMLLREIDKHLDPHGECTNCPLFKNAYCNTDCKAMKLQFGLGFSDKSPFCTIDVPGSLRYEVARELNNP